MKGLLNRVMREKVYQYRGATGKFLFIKKASKHFIQFGSGAPSGTAKALLYLDYGAANLYNALYFGHTGTWTAMGASVMPLQTTTYRIPLTSLQAPGTGADLGSSAGTPAGALGMTVGTYATATPLLTTEVANGNKKTDKGRFQFRLPLEYVAGSDVVVRVRALRSGTLAATPPGQIDVECVKATDSVAGSDICATTIQNILATAGGLTASNFDFTITGTGLVAGDLLDLQVTAIADDTGGTNSKVVQIVDLIVFCATQG